MWAEECVVGDIRQLKRQRRTESCLYGCSIMVGDSFNMIRNIIYILYYTYIMIIVYSIYSAPEIIYIVNPTNM